MRSKSVISILEENEPKPLFVAFSAFIDKQVEEQTRQAGFDLVIEAPLTQQKIEQNIMSKLHHRRILY